MANSRDKLYFSFETVHITRSVCKGWNQRLKCITDTEVIQLGWEKKSGFVSEFFYFVTSFCFGLFFSIFSFNIHFFIIKSVHILYLNINKFWANLFITLKMCLTLTASALMLYLTSARNVYNVVKKYCVSYQLLSLASSITFLVFFSGVLIIGCMCLFVCIYTPNWDKLSTDGNYRISN